MHPQKALCQEDVLWLASHIKSKKRETQVKNATQYTIFMMIYHIKVLNETTGQRKLSIP